MYIAFKCDKTNHACLHVCRGTWQRSRSHGHLPLHVCRGTWQRSRSHGHLPLHVCRGTWQRSRSHGHLPCAHLYVCMYMITWTKPRMAECSRRCMHLGLCVGEREGIYIEPRMAECSQSVCSLHVCMCVRGSICI
jgi:hypothetical protein